MVENFFGLKIFDLNIYPVLLLLFSDDFLNTVKPELTTTSE